MKYLLIIFFIFYSSIYSQTRELDFDYFIYGLNYNHYSYISHGLKKDSNQIDVFFDSLKEDIIAEYLIKKIKEDSINYVNVKRIDRGSNYVTDRNDKLSQYYLYSEFIKEKLEENFSPNFLIQEEEHSVFKNDNQINSYITGAYLRQGEKINDTIFKISNSGSRKPSYCFNILKKTNCTNVVYKTTEEFNPIDTVYFNPSNELKEYFDIVKHLLTRKKRIKSYLLKILTDEASAQKNNRKRKKAFKLVEDFDLRVDEGFHKENIKEISIVKELLVKTVL